LGSQNSVVDDIKTIYLVRTHPQDARQQMAQASDAVEATGRGRGKEDSGLIQKNGD
jgi:hypothetical protein